MNIVLQNKTKLIKMIQVLSIGGAKQHSLFHHHVAHMAYDVTAPHLTVSELEIAAWDSLV